MRFSVCAALLLLPAVLLAARPLVIAHRGASGYLPEHTLQSAAYAHALRADYIEQDVVLSRDDRLVVLHDIHLETTTDVARRFPQRARRDGRFYAIDFTWAELSTLHVTERVDPRRRAAVFPQRFPANEGSFRLCTLDEQLTLIRGLDRSTGRTTGVYVEFKDPAFHTAAGKDLGAAVLRTLAQFGYKKPTDAVYVQCFDAAALRRLREELKTQLKLVLLMDGGSPLLGSEPAWHGVANYAHGVGPPVAALLAQKDAGAAWMAAAHRNGLIVHPYTLRQDALPPGFRDFPTLISTLREAGADGFFTDHPDVVRKLLSEE